jgi:hypothetical protein
MSGDMNGSEKNKIPNTYTPTSCARRAEKSIASTATKFASMIAPNAI